MNARHRLSLIIAAALLASGCSKTNDSRSTAQATKEAIQNTKAAVNDATTAAKDGLADSWDELKDCTFEERSEFSIGVHRMADRMDGDVREMNARFAGLPDAAVKDRDSVMEELKEAGIDLKAKLSDLDHATADTWSDAKERVNVAWMRVQAAFDRLKSDAGY